MKEATSIRPHLLIRTTTKKKPSKIKMVKVAVKRKMLSSNV